MTKEKATGDARQMTWHERTIARMGLSLAEAHRDLTIASAKNHRFTELLEAIMSEHISSGCDTRLSNSMLAEIEQALNA